MFMSCHPDLPRESQIALTLKVIGGLQTSEIARAKKRLKERGAQFELPDDETVGQRLATVLAVVYATFNEGYAATSGEHWTRPELCRDALRLGRRLAALRPAALRPAALRPAALRPAAPEAHGLLALMDLQASRLHARQGPGGEPVLLYRQDRRQWDGSSIHRGLASLRRSGDLGGGPYIVQAEIAACHAVATSVESTDWARIAALYTVLAHLKPSPVVQLNRAAAAVHADGPAAGLRLLAAIEELDGYPVYHVTRGDALERLGESADAVAAFELAAALETNDSLRAIFAALPVAVSGA